MKLFKNVNGGLYLAEVSINMDDTIFIDFDKNISPIVIENNPDVELIMSEIRKLRKNDGNNPNCAERYYPHYVVEMLQKKFNRDFIIDTFVKNVK